MSDTLDFAVIGGGVCGLTLALELKRRNAGAKIAVFEKEDRCGEHASGRNSGVLHAGFYYTADSLKARFTRDGNRAMADYCERRGIPVNRCGKLIVARSRDDLAVFDTLLSRAVANGVALERIDLAAAREIEPRVRSIDECLFSPDTASVDPRLVMAALVEDARRAGIDIRAGEEFLRRKSRRRFSTNKGNVEAGFVVNAAGLYADRIARQYGFARDYVIMPFKGLYLVASNKNSVATNIYPVPDIRNPFLGVHYTVGADGTVTIGPTAIPAFWREHYAGLGNFRLNELVGVVGEQLTMFLRNDFGFRDLAIQELPKYSKRRMIELAAELADDVHVDGFDRWGDPGIRAQLVDISSRELVMDFLFECDSDSFHLLNAVSPAFTCSLAIAPYLVNRIEASIHA